MGSDVPQLADGLEKTSLAQVRTRNPNEIVQLGRLPQQGSSSKRGAPLPRSGQVTPLAHQPSDSDLDSYFNDEDNDAFLAVEDTAMHGVESSDALSTIGSGVQSVVRNANLNSEVSRSGSPPAPASVNLPNQRIVPS